MRREYHRWFSPSLGRDMELLVFGHAGARVLVFPTSKGRFFEWEDRGMMNTLGEHLHKGWLQIFCVDSVDAESWYANWMHPSDRARRQGQYDAYLLNEVLPLSQKMNSNPFLITAGASFGAYHAMNFGLRYPHLVKRILAMSGFYEMKRWTDGFSDANVYAHNPMDFVQHEHDHGRLQAMRQMDIIMAIGRDDTLFGNNQAFSNILWGKGLWHALRIWDGWCHDWPYWQNMILQYIGGSD